jgi:site-specific DNA-methyltransferase (adenine-specific)
MGKRWDTSGVAFRVETWQQVFRVLKPGAHLLAFGGTRTYHRMVCAIEDAGFEIRDSLCWLYGSGFPKSLHIGRAMDGVLGTQSKGFNTAGESKRTIARPELRSDNDAYQPYTPTTDAAKQWDGWGTALKPAQEPIVLARKPFKGTVAANVLAHGVGALNIDACRIGYQSDADKVSAIPQGMATNKRGALAGSTQHNGPRTAFQPSELRGRWPSNVLLDESSAVLLDAQSGDCGANGGGLTTDFRNRQSGFAMSHGPLVATDNIGGASRFFYVAKPSREERDYGCWDLPQRSGGEATDRTDGSAVVNSPRAGAGRTGGSRNHHPTVKPVELMRYLVRLVCPPDGTVLDPFMGSGTTGMACRYELRDFIGIERELEYVAIAERRIAACAPLFGEQTA